jgi:hypothetical protein
MVAACVALAAAWPSHARRGASAWVPDYARLQYGGSLGLVSIGAGKSFLGGRIEPDLDYGYAPEWASGVAIHILSQTTTLSLMPLDLGGAGRLYPVMAGYSTLLGLGERYFLVSEKYADYYWPSALHFRFFTGMKFTGARGANPWMSGWAGTVQIGAIDSDIVAAYANRSVGAGDVVTAALAVNLYLGGQGTVKPP